MFLLEKLESQIKQYPQSIIFTDGDDPRVMRAARRYLSAKFGEPILIGNAPKIKAMASNLNIDIEPVTIIDPENAEETDDLVERMKNIPPYDGKTTDEIRSYLKDPRYFGTMLLESGQADTLLAGASIRARSAMLPLIELLPRNDFNKEITSMILLDTRNPGIGSNGLLLLADTLVHPMPTESILAENSVSVAKICEQLVRDKPRVAMLSYTNVHINSNNPSTKRMQNAVQHAQDLARSINLPCDIAGEMQVDVALDSSIARLKEHHDLLNGNANILVFPNLDAANISLKMLQIVSDIRTYGPILIGFEKAAGCITRSMQSKDIYGTAILLAYLALHDSLLDPLDNGSDPLPQ